MPRNPPGRRGSPSRLALNAASQRSPAGLRASPGLPGARGPCVQLTWDLVTHVVIIQGTLFTPQNVPIGAISYLVALPMAS